MSRVPVLCTEPQWQSVCFPPSWTLRFVLIFLLQDPTAAAGNDMPIEWETSYGVTLSHESICKLECICRFLHASLHLISMTFTFLQLFAHSHGRVSSTGCTSD
jgi:hypothetical protein